MKIIENLYNANCKPKYVFAEKYFERWDPKIHGPCNYLQIFNVTALIDKCGNNNHYPLAMFRNGISKNTRPSYKGTMNNGTPSSSSDSEMASKIKKRFVKKLHATFDKKINFNCHALKLDDDDLFNNR